MMEAFKMTGRIVLPRERAQMKEKTNAAVAEAKNKSLGGKASKELVAVFQQIVNENSREALKRERILREKQAQQEQARQERERAEKKAGCRRGKKKESGSAETKNAAQTL